MKLNKSVFFFSILHILCFTLSNNACQLTLSDDESRGSLLLKALIACKMPCWSASCASRYPNCVFSRERRSYDGIVERLLQKNRGRPSVPNNPIKRICLECRRDICSHPASCAGLGIFLTVLTTLCSVEHIDNIQIDYAWIPKCVAAAAPVLGLGIDYCCLACLTTPDYTVFGPETLEPDGPFVPVMDLEEDIT